MKRWCEWMRNGCDLTGKVKVTQTQSVSIVFFRCCPEWLVYRHGHACLFAWDKLLLLGCISVQPALRHWIQGPACRWATTRGCSPASGTSSEKQPPMTIRPQTHSCPSDMHITHWVWGPWSSQDGSGELYGVSERESFKSTPLQKITKWSMKKKKLLPVS